MKSKFLVFKILLIKTFKTRILQIIILKIETNKNLINIHTHSVIFHVII